MPLCGLLQKCLGAFRLSTFNFHNIWRVSQETRHGGRRLLWIATNRFWRTIMTWTLKDISCFSVSISVLLFCFPSLLFIFQGISCIWHPEHSPGTRLRARWLKKKNCCGKCVFVYRGAKRCKEHALCRHLTILACRKVFMTTVRWSRNGIS